MSKQDRQGSRTPAQLNQEFKFGKTFAETFELAEKASEKAEKAKSAVYALDKKLTQDEIFNRLTKNGEVEGIYRDEKGNVYINASYMVSGILRSKDGKNFYLDLDNGVLKGQFEELKINGKTVDEIAKETAENEVGGQTQADIFNKLTNNGTAEGIYIKDGQMYINASYLATGILASKDGKTFYLDLDNGILKGQFSEFSISGKTVDDIAQEKANTAESNAITTAAGDATGKANAAQQNAQTYADRVGKNAIDTAAADATSKANAAQSNAIRTASDDASNKANSALSSAKTYADVVASAAVNAQTQADIFNKLTNNGSLKGIYMKDGELYVNGTYMKAGTIDAEIVKIINLIADTIECKDQFGNLMRILGGVFTISENGNNLVWLTTEYTGYPVLMMTKYNGSNVAVRTTYGPEGFGIVDLSGIVPSEVFSLRVGDDRKPCLSLPGSGYLNLYWEDNGNGSHTLMGSESADLNGQRYTKVFDLGNVGGTTSNHRSYSFEHGIPSNYKIVKCEGYTTGSNATTLPTIQGGLVTIWADKTKVYLYREIAYTPPADERLYVQLWYTK